MQNEKQFIDIKSLQRIVANVIISSAPKCVDTMHVKDMYIENREAKYLPEHVTVSSTSACADCNITVHFDKVDCTNVHYDRNSNKLIGYNYSPSVTVNIDSRTKSVADMRTAMVVCNDMLQLAEKIESTLQQYVVVNAQDA